MSRLLMNESQVLAALVLLRVTLLLGAAWLLHRALRGRNPWWQISLWRVVCVAVVAIAAIGPYLPGWGPILGPTLFGPTLPGPLPRRSAPIIATYPRSFDPAVPQIEDDPDMPATSADQEAESLPVPPPVPLPPPMLVLESVPQPAAANPRKTSLTIEVALSGCYLLVAGILLARLLLQFLRLRAMIGKAWPANDRVAGLVSSTALSLGISKPPHVLVSSLSSGPLVAGILRPVIVLPAGFAEQLSEHQLRLVMAHECCHIAGRDLAWALAVRVLRILLWPHPLSWGMPAAHRFACDVRCDVIAAGQNAFEYSQMLASLALSFQPRAAAPLALAFLEKSETVRRINLLDAGIKADRPPRLGRMRAAIGMAIVLGFVGTLGINAVQTRIALGQADADDAKKQIQVKIQDPDENPVEGAEVRIQYFDIGNRFDGADDCMATTDKQGIALIDVPARLNREFENKDLEIRLRLDIRHPDFVSSNLSCGLDQPIELTLQLGRRVRLSALDTATGKRITQKLFVLHQSNNQPEEVQWKLLDDGVFLSHPLDIDIKRLLVVALREGELPLFSDLIDLGDFPAGDCRIDDVPLSPGAHVKGRLSANVPRPVKNGTVQLRIEFATDEQSKYPMWDDATKVNDDGSFEFRSVPRNGWMQVVADCEGWVSAVPLADAATAERLKSIQQWGDSIHLVAAQQFSPEASGPLSVIMEPAAECEIALTDDRGQPVPNATIGMMAGTYFYPLCTCYGVPRRTADTLRFNAAEIEQLLEKAVETGLPVTVDFDSGAHQAVTDAKGLATIRNLPGIKLHIDVTHDAFQLPREQGEVALKSGETTRMKLTLQRSGATTPGQPGSDEMLPAKKNELLGGKVERDAELPNHPIVGLDLDHSKVTDAELEELAGQTHLKTLNLSSTQITDAGLAHISGLTSLEALELGGAPITDAGLEHLKGLTNLRTLDFNCRYSRKSHITDAGLVHLHGLTKLESIDLDGTDVTGAGLVHLKGLTNLVQLLLHNLEIEDDSLEHLLALQSLQCLSLGRTAITDAGISRLSGLPNLETLFLTNTHLTGAGFENLKEMASLDAIQLSSSPVTDVGLKSLGQLTGLTRLYLDETLISDAGLEHLQGLGNLKSLDLSRTQIGDRGLAHLQGLVGMTELALNRTPVTDAGLEHLSGLKKLQTLELGGTQVTDAGMEHLKGLTNLRRLNLQQTQVSKDARGMLRKALPKCEITTDRVR